MMRQLNYPGDCRDIVGQVVGPTLLGQWLTIIDARYDVERDVTEATLRPSTQAEFDTGRPFAGAVS